MSFLLLFTLSIAPALEPYRGLLLLKWLSLTMFTDQSQVLFVELQLPINGDPNSAPVTRTVGHRGQRGRRKASYSTSKDILEKLKPLHPLPGVILEWRRICNALTKQVFPLQKEKIPCPHLNMFRIFGECQLHTSTGRVSMSEPNLQNIPKDFEIAMPGRLISYV